MTRVLEADVFTEGAVFPFVTFCAAKNPQQKRAEGFIRLRKNTAFKRSAQVFSIDRLPRVMPTEKMKMLPTRLLAMMI